MPVPGGYSEAVESVLGATSMSAEQAQWYRPGSGLTGTANGAYEQYLVPAIFRPWAEELLEVATPTAGARVLDIACGTGVVARLVGPLVGVAGRVVGLDLNSGMLEVARSLPWNAPAAVEWREANAAELPFDDATFDLVLCQQGLQFFPDRPAALRAMHRVLRADGRLALSVWRPIECSPGFECLHHALTRYIGPEAGISAPFALGDAGELQDLVSGAGFRDVSIRAVRKMLRFPSPEELVRRYVAATPLAIVVAQVDSGVRMAIIEEVRRDLAAYTGDGELVFAIESHLTLAVR